MVQKIEIVQQLQAEKIQNNDKWIDWRVYLLLVDGDGLCLHRVLHLQVRAVDLPLSVGVHRRRYRGGALA